MSILTVNSLMLFEGGELLSFHAESPKIQLFVLSISSTICNWLSLIASYACCAFVLGHLFTVTNSLLKKHLSLVPALGTLFNLFATILLKILQGFNFETGSSCALLYEIIFAIIVGGYAFSKLHLARIFREVNAENPVLQLMDGQQISIPFGFAYQEGDALLFSTQCKLSQLSLVNVKNISFTDASGDTIRYEHNYADNKFHWCKVQ